MEDKISRLRSSCSEINFGAVTLSEAEKQLCREWNHEIISFCRSLPESTQTDALLFFMRYCKASFEEINFFGMYYVPSWSIVYWLIRCCPHNGRLDRQDIKNAKAAHFMAMFLHALDDHLRDHQVPTTHLALLLRSQSWLIMNAAARSLAAELKDGEQIIENFIDDYYCSIRSEKKLKSLDDYCAHFRRQMATWFIVPIILTKRINPDEAFPRAVQSAYGSFGVAWRLLDDIQDMEIDMSNGIQSAIFVCLPEEMQKLWLMQSDWNPHDKQHFLESVTDHILQKDIIGTLKQKICSELKSAAVIASDYHLSGLADEFDCLSKPLT